MPQITAVQRRGRWVTIAFDHGPPLRCDRDFLLTRAFAVGQSIEAALLERVRAQALQHQAEAMAVRWLATRPRSRADLNRRLRRQELPDDAITAALDSLQTRGYLDDRAFAQAWTANRLRFHPRARRLIAAELQAEGVAAALASEATAEVDDASLALQFAERRVARFRGDWETFRNRVGAALTRRGFPYHVSERALRAAWEAEGPAPSRDSPTP